MTKVHCGESSRRDDGAVARRPLPTRQIPPQWCQRQDTTRAEQRHILADGRWCEPGLQGTDSGRHTIRAQGCVEPTVQMAHIKALEKGTAKYPLRPVDCKVYTITQGVMSHTQENLFLGTLPKRLILWCVDNNAYNGDYSKKTSTPRITALTSWRSTSIVVKCRPNRSSQTSRPVTTFEATSTCSPQQANKRMMKATS